MEPIDINRIGQDLWPRHRQQLIKRALRAAEGIPIRLTLGEAETLARQETEREIFQRRKFFDRMGLE